MSAFLGWFRKPTTTERLSKFGLRSDVVAAAQAMASYRSSDPQVVALGSSLDDSERVLRMMDGRCGRAHGLLVLTDARIFFKARDGDVSFNVSLDDISAIQGSTHRLVGTVQVMSGDGTYLVDEILGTQGESLAEEAREAMSGVVPPVRDALAALGELRALRDRGEISEREYEDRKAELWGEI